MANLTFEELREQQRNRKKQEEQRDSNLRNGYNVTIAGSDTHVILKLPDDSIYSNTSPYIYMGSVISVSASVYTNKTPVFSLGSQVIDGFSRGNKYVAGSMVTTVFIKDNISAFLDKIERQVNSTNLEELEKYYGIGSRGRSQNFLRDDISSFDIHLISATEYAEDVSRMIIYDASFINNSYVFSIDDLITENVVSFVARDIKEQHSILAPRSGIAKDRIPTASDLL